MAEARTLEKLKAFFAEEQYYEAEQLYRTLFARYNTQKKFNAAIELLQDGAIRLLNLNQINSGAVVANLMVQTFINSNASVSREHLGIAID